MQRIVTNISYRGYSADGQMLSAEYGNGVAELREYDQQGRLVGKELIDSAGFIVEERIWTYDTAGNVIERTQSSVSLGSHLVSCVADVDGIRTAA